MGHIRMYVVALILLLPAVGGVVAIHASPTCQRLVHTYVTTPVRNRVSKPTLDAWAKWAIGHPNWKPNPNLHRPKYVMTRKEAIEKVDFACQVPIIPSNTEIVFPPNFMDGPPMESSQISFPAFVPPAVTEATPELAATPVVPPFYIGNLPPVPLEPTEVAMMTPEPPSLLLVALGMAAAGFFWMQRMRRTA